MVLLLAEHENQNQALSSHATLPQTQDQRHEVKATKKALVPPHIEWFLSTKTKKKSPNNYFQNTSIKSLPANWECWHTRCKQAVTTCTTHLLHIGTAQICEEARLVSWTQSKLIWVPGTHIKWNLQHLVDSNVLDKIHRAATDFSWHWVWHVAAEYFQASSLIW